MITKQMDHLHEISTEINKYLKNLDNKIRNLIYQLDEADEKTALEVCKKVSGELDDIYQSI